mmetsp:Transcript_28518/g.25245  ORF Transcript_28518/g.25245 Transcript_28518/m.25245 type:complete len:144 (-) Transcript_28518:406-837(-)
MEFCDENYKDFSQQRIHLNLTDHLLPHLSKEDSINFQKYFEVDTAGDSLINLRRNKSKTIEEVFEIKNYGTKVETNITTLFINPNNKDYIYIGFGQGEKSLDPHVNQNLKFQYIIGIKKEDIKVSSSWKRVFKINIEDAYCQY